MKRILFLFQMCILVGVSSEASARTDCQVAKILNIQLEGEKIMYFQEGAPWRTLGYVNKNDGTKERYAALLAAQMAGKKVVVGYKENGYDCNVTNYGVPAFIVRTFNE
ncbi:MAG: hypothetical protein KJ856_07760 [Gammaproteobacteria bacterium]|nr:hypothetical protein [Gammaproteobacteria bacterium]MBU1479825.1 hypothetical protein [Gammaproteobacteria bacterium]MBU1999515.1 hypothetical protein [Gammaproteobacteria bacterium]MBU2130676.1 hypothetical protein [Gammaproteobacteria bacterium]MBU2186914.1 hypothetical protein [Gammaproteobacteria bacterium]